MNIKINCVHFDADQKLEEFVKNKVGKLDNFFDGIVGSEVFLTFDKSEKTHTENKISKILLEIPGGELFAEKQAKTFEEAVDLSIEALRKQIQKYKEKLK
jgi:putative sigma-54 modulation protein